MRLLNVHTFKLHDFTTKAIPPYVIASHRWCDEETTFRDVQERRNVETDGYKKVEGFAEYVRNNVASTDWLWIDTCCIDKTSSKELDDAINSMFDWYRKSVLCLTFLLDVHDSTLR